MEIDPNELVESADAAALLNQKPNTLVTWRHEGRGPKYLKIGRRVYYRRSDICAYLGSLLKDPASSAAANKQAAIKRRQFEEAAARSGHRDTNVA